jgi:two-component system nitrogen regulation response regulator NtrX
MLNSMSNEILIVDDEPDIRRLTAQILNDEGFRTTTAADSKQVFNYLDHNKPAAVVLDVFLQGSDLDGLGILDELNRMYPKLPIIMISGHGTIETAVAALKRGAYDFLEKPFPSERLISLVKRALEVYWLREKYSELRTQLSEPYVLIGQSAWTDRTRRELPKLAKSNSRVLITGPAGCGKEALAQAIHAASSRANALFVVVNCATLREQDFERELFGYQSQGNPTTGEKPGYHKGLLEKAFGGTLFLREVTDISPECQGKMARILQDPNFSPVGSATRLTMDTRIIASSQKNLAEEVEQKRFRADLFFRLNVIPLPIPPLAARREDILPLANDFMASLAATMNLSAKPFSPAAIELLHQYAWPGNARELRNLIERLLILLPWRDLTEIPAESVAQLLKNHGFEEGETLNPHTPSDTEQPALEFWDLPYRQAKTQFEQQYLARQLKRHHGNIARTAASVGIERTALHRKLKGFDAREEVS